MAAWFPPPRVLLWLPCCRMHIQPSWLQVACMQPQCGSSILQASVLGLQVDLLPLPPGVPEQIPIVCNGHEAIMILRSQVRPACACAASVSAQPLHVPIKCCISCFPVPECR